MGFVCSDRATTADFLTSLTNPMERIVREGYELQVPRTPDDFARVWRNSPQWTKLREDIDEYDSRFHSDGEQMEKLRAFRYIRKLARR